MRRRDFLGTLAAAAALPAAARAQAPISASMPTLGYLGSGSSNSQPNQVAVFFRALADAGFVEGRSLAVHYRWADDHYDRLPMLARELVDLRVSVIAATGGPVTAIAAKNATTTIPIVFTAVSDPVRFGLVASMNRPGGNITGTGGLVDELDAKRLELLHEIMPNAKRIGALFNPNRPGVDAQIDALRAVARTSGLDLVVLRAGAVAELGALFSEAASARIEALLISADPFFAGNRELLVQILTRHRIAGIFQRTEFAAAGGLISYGPSFIEAYREAGVYAARILKGEKPADLPILQPSTFELAINLRTAKTLGLTVPPTLIARADEVIE